MFAAAPILGAAAGGFDTATWCLAALFALALLVVTLAIAPPSAPAGVWRAAVAAYGAFCAWSYVSILWADARGDAWDGANRTLLYGLVLVLVGLRPWSRRGALAALSIVAFGSGALALAVLLRGATGDAAQLFLEGRLAAPTGYANATAALWLIAFWPALHLATGSERALAWPLRALALSTASLLLQTALLSQSRGAAAGFAAAAATYLALAPQRRRAAAALAALLVSAAAAWQPLVAVRRAGTPAELAGAFADARAAIALSVLAAFAAGAAGAWAGRRLRGRWPSPPVAQRRSAVGRRVTAPALLALVAAVIAFAQPVGWAGERWRDFKSSGYSRVETGGSRFSGSLGSNRYDFYRVALGEFRAHPLLGIGADNFAAAYLSQRRSAEAPRYTHSLAFGLLAQLGLPGAALFAAFVAFALASARRVRRLVPARAGVVAAALAGFVAWLAQGMVDWLWEFPALSVGALALLALAARAGAAEESPPAAALRPLLAAGLGLAALAGALSLALPGLAARSIAAARASAASDPALALAHLRRAAKLDVLGARPLVAEAVIARRAGLPERARAALGGALEREPRNWFAHLELALLRAHDGERAAALRSLARAAALNPRQPLLGELRGALARGERIDATAVEVALGRGLDAKLRATATGR